RTVWANGQALVPDGTPDGAIISQDDMAVLSRATNGFGYRPDDHSDFIASPAWLSPGPAYGGVIERTADVDYFAFRLDTRTTITASVTVADVAPNLDAWIEIRNPAGNVLASRRTESLGESITMTLDPGEYRLAVRSEGVYGDVGR